MEARVIRSEADLARAHAALQSSSGAHSLLPDAAPVSAEQLGRLAAINLDAQIAWVHESLQRKLPVERDGSSGPIKGAGNVEVQVGVNELQADLDQLTAIASGKGQEGAGGVRGGFMTAELAERLLQSVVAAQARTVVAQVQKREYVCVCVCV